MEENKTAPVADRLRASILQEAVQGRLVPQDPSDEPAWKLLDRIREERRELVRQKKAKAPKGGESRIWRAQDGSWYEQRGKGEAACIDGEIPFEIPESWEWARLGQVTTVVSGTSYKKSDITNSGIRILRGGNLVDNQIKTFDNDVFIGSNFFDHDKQPKKGDVVITASTGSSKAIGRPAFCFNDAQSAQIGAFLRIIRPSSHSIISWLRAIFSGEYYRARIRRLAVGTNINNIKESYLTEFLIPVPPLAEQKRIVERVDELMPLVDALETKKEELDAIDTAFWKALPQSILQEAVQGRLVPQDPSDEPAWKLLDRIREERRELVRQKKVKAPKGGDSRIWRAQDGSWYEQRGKGEAACIDGEIPFDVPDSWSWARLSTLALVLNGDRGKNYPAKSRLHHEGIPFVSAINITNRKVVEDQMLYMTDEQYDALGAGKLVKGDYVFCIRGSLGKYGVFQFEKGAIASSLVIVRTFDGSLAMRDYVGMLLGVPLTSAEIRNYNNGTAQPNLSAANFERFLYPVPPLTEQERIVKRVDELMAAIKELS